jgi:hypothetical protein
METRKVRPIALALSLATTPLHGQAPGIVRLSSDALGAGVCVDGRPADVLHAHVRVPPLAALRTCSLSGWQQWTIDPAAGGTVVLRSVVGARRDCLDAPQAVLDGATVRVTACRDVSTQRWRRVPRDDGSERITSEFHGAELCLDVAEGRWPLPALCLRRCEDGAGQRWRVFPFDPARFGSPAAPRGLVVR